MILGQPVLLKPAYGMAIRKEDGQYLHAQGETVMASSYWLRRLAEGDVDELVQAQPAAPVDPADALKPVSTADAINRVATPVKG